MAFIMMVLIIMRYLETFIPSLESIVSYTWSEYYDPIEILCSLGDPAGISIYFLKFISLFIDNSKHVSHLFCSFPHPLPFSQATPLLLNYFFLPSPSPSFFYFYCHLWLPVDISVLKNLFYSLVMCMSVGRYVSMSAGAPAGQERVSDLLELELYVVGNHLIQVLGTELWSSGRVSSNLISPGQFLSVFRKVIPNCKL